MRRTFVIFCTLVVVGVLSAQAQQHAVTADDYARAESFLYSGDMVVGASIRPSWLEGDRFWYRNTLAEGAEYILVDPKLGTRTQLFDHERLARALSAVSEEDYTALKLPGNLEVLDAGDVIRVSVDDSLVRCVLREYVCTSEAGASEQRSHPDHSIMSPDGKLAAFIREHNLWAYDIATGEERQLTTDGIEDFGYATNNAGWIRGKGPVLLWSPNSKMIATFQHDARGVGEMYMVSTQVGHPELEAWKYPLPGDSLIFRISRVVIHVDEPRVVRLNMPPDAHRSTTTDHIAGRDGRLLDAQWSVDGRSLAFISSSRDHKEARLRIANPETGEVREVLEERVETYFESGVDAENWHVFFETDEVLWFSERDNWGHLYLYDLTTGVLKHQITSGEWAVQQVRRIDTDTRTIYFTAGGREEGDPYYHYLYRVSLDGGEVELLTPGNAHHTTTFTPSGHYFIDSYSTPATPPVIVLRDTEGRLAMSLAEADASQLQASGWQPPTSFTVKARDGETDLYGLMYKPTNFDSTRSYPVLNYLYPGPQSGSVGSRSFRASRGDKQAVAELGFVVVEVDAMGTPGRSKSFHDAYYGNMGDNGLPDQIAMIKELGSRHAWIDLDRVGIWGHSGGGFASAAAILRYPDFYKVAVSGAGNHDNRNYEDDWGEKWQGLLEGSNYDNQANQLLAENLKGKLLIAHGLLDGNVPASSTLLLTEALVAANKDFDMIVFPNEGHGFGSARFYWMRKRWDYFVRHLLHVEPPKEYEFGRQSVRITRPAG